MKKLVIIFVSICVVNSLWAQVPHQVVPDLKLDIDPRIRNYTEKVKDLNMDMVFVEGGSYTMGCTAEQENCLSNVKPAHKEKVESFYMARTEVTQAQWALIMEDKPSGFKDCDHCPVEQVNRVRIQEFIQKLNGLTGQSYRLPSAAEWEYAARGGQFSCGYKYSGSNNIGDVAWHSGNSGGKSHTVGTLKPNELGINDMSGNVFEWCSDRCSYNYNSPRNWNPLELRGGSWYVNSWGCQVSYRFCHDSLAWDNSFGFRLCRTFSSMQMKQVHTQNEKLNIEESTMVDMLTTADNCRIYCPNCMSTALTWSGECKNGKGTGQGQVNYYQNQDIIATYRGFLKGGYFDSIGLFIIANEARFEGKFKNGLLTNGLKSFANGNKMEGEFNGEYLINGIKTFKTYSNVDIPETFEGTFVNNSLEGQGEHCYPCTESSMVFFYNWKKCWQRGEFKEGKLYNGKSLESIGYFLEYFSYYKGEKTIIRQEEEKEKIDYERVEHPGIREMSEWSKVWSFIFSDVYKTEIIFKDSEYGDLYKEDDYYFILDNGTTYNYLNYNAALRALYVYRQYGIIIKRDRK